LDAVIVGTDPSAYPGVDEKGTEALEFLDRHYEHFRAEEAREPLPDDQLVLYVSADHPEYEALRHVVGADRLAAGVLTRQELQDTGFSFVNVLGGAAKGIISGVVIDPDSGQEYDFTGRLLLTREELEVVHRFQQSQPEVYGLQGEDVDEVRKDMLSFAQEAVGQPPFVRGEDFAAAALDYRLGNVMSAEVGTEDDWWIVRSYWDRQLAAYRREHPEATEQDWELHSVLQEQFAKEHCAKIYEWVDGEGDAFNTKQVRGHATQSLSGVRGGKLSGQLSPFLDSGYVFGDNLDCNVFLGDEVDQRSSDQVRINTATIHLAGAQPDFPGFSEMGGRTDQQYMPTGVYVNTLYPHDAYERRRIHSTERTLLSSQSCRDLIRAGQQRLIDVAQEQAPSVRRRGILRRRR
jgi:hypothetical protein